MKYTLTIVATLALALVRQAPAADSLAEREERAMQAAMARVAPSVVRIETVGGLERIGRVLIGTGPTTGLIISPDGYVISSAFNFAQKPDSILVTLGDGVRHPAKLVAADHSRMVVLLKIEGAENLPVCEAVPRGEMRVGQWALAVGRAFEAGQPNLSVGIVSALDRIWGKAVQTDAKISPNNYGGPLVDISGRVLGVLVPMSADENADVAGVEWYDSGIGFAIPLESIQRVLPQLAAGKPLDPGLLGISMKGEDIYSLPAEIAVSRAKGPAYAAGLRPGDTIVEIAGQPITRQAELKQVLGNRYAGETVSVVVTRGKDGKERIARDIELVGSIDPYEFPFLGILPLRTVGESSDGGLNDGVGVRYVYPKSPAAEAGIEPADRVVAIAGQKITKLADAVAALQNVSPDQMVAVEVRRGDKALPLELKPARLPEALPGELPRSHGDAPAVADAALPNVGEVALKFPEFPNECKLYVPENYNPRVSYGVLIWLPAPGRPMPQDVVAQWRPICEKYDLLLLAPQPLEPTKWLGLESHFIRRALDDVLKNYNVDRSRIVAHGHEAGGAMAYLFGFGNSDLVRGIATTEAFLPRVVSAPETDPVRPIAIYTSLASMSDLNMAGETTIRQLRQLKHPVTVQEIAGAGRYLNEQEMTTLARWIDALDRM